MTSKTLFTKEKKKEKLDLIKVKTFALLKILLQKIKKNLATNWEKIFANHIYYNGLHPQFMMNSQNNIKKYIYIKNRQKNRTGTSLNSLYGW